MIGNGPIEALFLQSKPLHLLFEFKPLNIAFAPTVAGKEATAYYGRVNQDPDTFFTIKNSRVSGCN
jgi:hypothetical protein